MFSSFELSLRETQDLEKRLVRLERAPEGESADTGFSCRASNPAPDYELARTSSTSAPKEGNHDPWEVSKLFADVAIEVDVQENGKGPFETHDRRARGRYVCLTDRES